MQIGWCVELDILLPPSLSPSLWVNPLLLSLGPAKPQTIDAVYSELSLKSPLWELVCVRLLRELHRPRGSVCVKMTSSWSALRVRGFVWCVPFSQQTGDTFLERWAAQRKRSGFHTVRRGSCLTWRARLLFLSNLCRAGSSSEGSWRTTGRDETSHTSFRVQLKENKLRECCKEAEESRLS